MATKHPRIAVVRDAELDLALRRAAARLGERRPAATLLRELALRGAEAIEAAPDAEAVRRLVAEHGARPAAGTLAEFLDERGPLDAVDGERHATRILDELRGERLP